MKASQASEAFVVAPTTLTNCPPQTALNSVFRKFVKNLLLVAKKWLNLSHQGKKKKKHIIDCTKVYLDHTARAEMLEYLSFCRSEGITQPELA